MRRRCENRSGSSPRVEKSLMSGRPPPSPAPPPNRWWSPRSSSLITSRVMQQPAEERLQRGRPAARPSARGSSAAGRRARSGWARAGARRSSMSDSPSGRAPGPSLGQRLQRGDGAVALGRSHPRVVHQLLERAQRRVLVRDRASAAAPPAAPGPRRGSSSGNSAATARRSAWYGRGPSVCPRPCRWRWASQAARPPRPPWPPPGGRSRGGARAPRARPPGPTACRADARR